MPHNPDAEKAPSSYAALCTALQINAEKNKWIIDHRNNNALRVEANFACPNDMFLNANGSIACKVFRIPNKNDLFEQLLTNSSHGSLFYLLNGALTIDELRSLVKPIQRWDDPDFWVIGLVAPETDTKTIESLFETNMGMLVSTLFFIEDRS